MALTGTLPGKGSEARGLAIVLWRWVVLLENERRPPVREMRMLVASHLTPEAFVIVEQAGCL
jgi:hypothetical protein